MENILKNVVELDEEQKQELTLMLRAKDLKSAIFEIQQRVFRPARKHGYPCRKIEKLIDKCGTSVIKNDFGIYEENNGIELISLLEDLFLEVLEEMGVKDCL